MGFTSPNHTQTPNDLFDTLLKDMGEAELRVVLVAIRQTLGYHKQYDAISYSRFEKLTGLSRQGVTNGIQAATERGLLREVGQGKRRVKLYELVIDPDQSTTLPSQGVDQSTTLPSTSLPSRHTKESISKEKEIKENTATKSRVIFEAIAKHVYGIANLKGLSKSSAGRIGKLEKIARQLITSRDPAATDELIARRVASFASAETFKPAIQGATGFELKFAAYLEVTHTMNKPRPESEPEDDEHLITPEQVAFARQLFNETVSKHNANSRPR